jgi:hypothetical protein
MASKGGIPFSDPMTSCPYANFRNLLLLFLLFLLYLVTRYC